jgi:phage anti-repressor protein
MLKLYWDPIFNDSWIYLSDELILGNLTNDNSRNAITDFYRRILIPTYQQDNDYIEISSTHILVKEYSAIRLSKKSNYKPAHNKKYYITTGEAYKCMLMASRSKTGQETRMYYLKVEKLARSMKDYIMEIMKQEKNVLNSKYSKLKV